MDHATNTTVFIVEDSPIVRDALADLLEGVEDLTVVGSAEDAPSAISAISRCRPDYVVLDYQLVGSTAVDVLRALHPTMPDVVFIVLTNHVVAQYRRVCMDAGASWFLDKTREFAKVKDIIAQLREPS
ncbi:MAG TPA: response regulator transcription factor [Casimicrobiaceae bacterium]